jgi:hypothetical protein
VIELCVIVAFTPTISVAERSFSREGGKIVYKVIDAR